MYVIVKHKNDLRTCHVACVELPNFITSAVGLCVDCVIKTIFIMLIKLSTVPYITSSYMCSTCTTNY